MHPLRASLSLRPYTTEVTKMDLPAVHATYVIVALIVAGLFNLGVFGVLLLGHLGLDVWKYWTQFHLRGRKFFEAILRENLLDCMLFFLALTTALYLNQSLPHIAALSAAGRTHVVLLRGLAVLLPKFTILHRTLRVLLNLHAWKMHKPVHFHASFTLSECTYLSALGIAIVLFALAPTILGMDPAPVIKMLGGILVPWRF